MIIDLTDVLAEPGVSKEYPVVFDSEMVKRSGITYPVLAKEPFTLRVVNEDGSKLHVTGDTSIHLEIPCDRCLDAVDVEIPVVIDESVPIANRVIQVPEDDRDDFYYVSDLHSLDCDTLARQQIMLSWPAKILCREDCKGLCPVCGQNLNIRDCGHNRSVPDPRMAAIRDIFENNKEV